MGGKINLETPPWIQTHLNLEGGKMLQKRASYNIQNFNFSIHIDLLEIISIDIFPALLQKAKKTYGNLNHLIQQL